MRALIVFCHPSTESYSAAICEKVAATLEDHGAEVRTLDLYTRGFQPILTRDEWQTHTDPTQNVDKVADDVALLKWCDALIFIYPTWWYGPPAMMKGWLEKSMVAGVAFHMPSEHDANIKRGLDNIRTLAVFTTCGATRFLSTLIGHPGRKIILRGLRILCHPRVRTRYVALYDMNHADDARRQTHIERVSTAARKLCAAHRPAMDDRQQIEAVAGGS
ncbi:MAG: NAD(P)H-dependent oxidoreductase [Pseudomonadota bacterium]